jgi:FkbM family methyltransferase
MSALFRAAALLDRIGARSLVARGVNLAHSRRVPGMVCSTDAESRWVNAQREATVVSPVIHTTPYADYRAWVLDNWCHGYLPQPGDTVIDIGAGVGEEAIVFSQLVGPAGHVFAIEAHPGVFGCLQETVRRSGLTNVTPLGLAVGAEDGAIEMALGDNFLTHSIVADRKLGASQQVPLRRLDSLATELGMGELALIKMNIEGAETDALRGMSGIAGQVRNLVISCHDFLAARPGGDPALRTKADCGPLLEGFGYSIATRPDHPDEWTRDYLYACRQ